MIVATWLQETRPIPNPIPGPHIGSSEPSLLFFVLFILAIPIALGTAWVLGSVIFGVAEKLTIGLTSTLTPERPRIEPEKNTPLAPMTDPMYHKRLADTLRDALERRKMPIGRPGHGQSEDFFGQPLNISASRKRHRETPVNSPEDPQILFERIVQATLARSSKLRLSSVDSSSVEGMITILCSSNKTKVRERMTRRLVRMGERAIPALVEAAKGANARERQAIDRILRRIRHQQE